MLGKHGKQAQVAVVGACGGGLIVSARVGNMMMRECPFLVILASNGPRTNYNPALVL